MDIKQDRWLELPHELWEVVFKIVFPSDRDHSQGSVIKDRVTILGVVCKTFYSIIKLTVSEVCLRSFDINVLPEVIKSYTKLIELDLNNNHFSGEWPPEDMRHMTQLQKLYMYHNSISSISSRISTFQTLSKVCFSSNNLEYIPSEIGTCVSLTKLFLPYNKIRELPEEITLLTNLVLMDCRENKLTSLPAGITALTNLAYLDITFNEFNSPPDLKKIMSNLDSYYY